MLDSNNTPAREWTRKCVKTRNYLCYCCLSFSVYKLQLGTVLLSQMKIRSWVFALSIRVYTWKSAFEYNPRRRVKKQKHLLIICYVMKDSFSFFFSFLYFVLCILFTVFVTKRFFCKLHRYLCVRWLHNMFKESRECDKKEFMVICIIHFRDFYYWLEFCYSCPSQ